MATLQEALPSLDDPCGFGGFTLGEWGNIIRKARRAAALANEDAKRKGLAKDPLAGAMIVYTDDPTAATIFAYEAGLDLPEMLNTSAIKSVCIVMGENFPSAAFEAERTDLEYPRIAALWMPPMGHKCPRCRKYTAPQEDALCGRCEQVTGG